MSQPSTAELRRIARETFGRELSDAQLEGYRGRLPTMARNIVVLQSWEERLREVEPALVQRVDGERS